MFDNRKLISASRKGIIYYRPSRPVNIDTRN